MPLKQLLRQLALRLYPRPLGLTAMGPGSLMMWPRRVQGARHIEIGQDTVIQAQGWLGCFTRYGDQQFSPRIRIGDHVRIGRGVIVTAVESVSIGDGCLLSEQVFVTDHTHEAVPGPVPPSRQPLVPRGPVNIGRHCFIGIRACILGGVTLGDHCIVGANSVVTRSFPAGSVVAGAPARLIKTLAPPQAAGQPRAFHGSND